MVVCEDAAETRCQKRSWECSCGNWNFGDREVCNMRSCRKRNPARGPEVTIGWTCPVCLNKNFPDRTVCNMRNCKQPRPGQERFLANNVGKPGSLPYERREREDRIRFSFRPKGNGKGNGTGNDWICICGNENFADREFCNMRKCGLARPGRESPLGPRFAPTWICECGNENFGDREFCNMRKCGQSRLKGERTTIDTYRPIRRQPSNNKPMWVCECGNENYDDRLMCNMRKCGLSRFDGGRRRNPSGSSGSGTGSGFGFGSGSGSGSGSGRSVAFL